MIHFKKIPYFFQHLTIDIIEINICIIIPYINLQFHVVIDVRTLPIFEILYIF